MEGKVHEIWKHGRDPYFSADRYEAMAKRLRLVERRRLGLRVSLYDGLHTVVGIVCGEPGLVEYYVLRPDNARPPEGVRTASEDDKMWTSESLYGHDVVNEHGEVVKKWEAT
jgi:hypothetical protein